ncbi:MAG: alpha-amylase family glycosyl hydrolase [Bacillus sp. (in: firmicutes)]
MSKRLLGIVLVSFLLIGGLPVSALEKEERLWQDEAVYSIMIDRFNNGSSKNDFDMDVQDLHMYNGGDFQGITDKLDYVKEMGFTAISLSPIFDNDQQGYDGKSVIDFYKTEEHFGSMKEFKRLVKEAHERDLKVVIEFVVDQVSSEHPWMKEGDKQGWFTEGSRLNLNQADVQNYLIDAAKFWMKETEIDGYYISQVQTAPEAFWKEFAARVKSIDEDFFLIGEVAGDDSKLSAAYEKAGFDSMINVPFTAAARSALGKVNRPFKETLGIIEESKRIYQKPNQLGLLLDDARTERFTREIVTNKHNPGTRWKLALAFNYTIPGIPFVFYGSEIALDGGGAPDNLKLLGFKADKEIIDFLKSLGELRQTLPALTRGSFDVLYEQDGMVVYKRTYKSETIVVAINNSAKTQHITLTEQDLAGKRELRGLLAGDLVREDGGEYKIVIDREEAEIYALTEKTGLNIGYIATIAGVWIIFALFIIVVMKRSKRNAS